jgi:hypothetical protein
MDDTAGGERTGESAKICSTVRTDDYRWDYRDFPISKNALDDTYSETHPPYNTIVETVPETERVPSILISD